MFLLIGLGNYGKKYEKTRHNFGFLALDKIIADHNFEALGEKFSSLFFAGKIAGEKILAIKPQTYMNLSGVAALEAVTFYKIPLENIIVLHDEIDIDLGRVKTKIGGGNAGHNGLRSLDEKIGKDYQRIRLGVGRPLNKEFEVSDYVLSKFSNDEMKIVENVNEKISAAIPLLIERKIDLFTNKIGIV